MATRKNFQNDLIKNLHKFASPERAARLTSFFQVYKGGYGEGDVFIGAKVPEIRLVARRHKDLGLIELEKLLDSLIHEERQCALFIMTKQFLRADSSRCQDIFELYIKKAREGRINNWDLVDVSAPTIVGGYLFDKQQADYLEKLASQDNLWLQRIAIIATAYFIDQDDYRVTLKLAEKFLSHQHDLIHKAVGWMLREVGKRSLSTEEEFVKKHCAKMPRTMLRYSIEKFDEPKRQRYLKCRQK